MQYQVCNQKVYYEIKNIIFPDIKKKIAKSWPTLLAYHDSRLCPGNVKSQNQDNSGMENNNKTMCVIFPPSLGQELLLLPRTARQPLTHLPAIRLQGREQIPDWMCGWVSRE